MIRQISMIKKYHSDGDMKTEKYDVVIDALFLELEELICMYFHDQF